jgi:hypothetical protein
VTRNKNQNMVKKCEMGGFASSDVSKTEIVTGAGGEEEDGNEQRLRRGREGRFIFLSNY